MATAPYIRSYLAPLLSLLDGMANAYPVVKLVNALLFVLAAVPVYAHRSTSPVRVVERRGRGDVPGDPVVYLHVADPHGKRLVPDASTALSCRRPRARTPIRPASAGADRAVALAVGTRPQFAALLPAFLAGALLLWALDSRRPPPPRALLRLWPTLGLVGAIGVYALVRLLGTSSPKEGSFGGYADLWRDYDPAARRAIRLLPPRGMGALPLRRPVRGRAHRARQTCCAPPAAAPSGRVRLPPRSSP